MNSQDDQLINAFKVKFDEKEINDFLRYANEIISSGRLIPGKFNALLEENFASFITTQFATTVSTGTAALEVIFKCLKLEKSDVLVPTNTNYATAIAAIKAGAKAVLYDSDLYPSLESIKEQVTERTKALVIVHIAGYISPDIVAIQEFCDTRGIYLIEDASHAHGSMLKGIPAGKFGEAAAFSMFATKVITTSEGGIITTDNKEIAKLSKVYRDQGKDTTGNLNIVTGSSWRMSELHAALGLAQMVNAENYISRNNSIAMQYKQRISKSEKLSIPIEANATYSGYKFVTLLKNEDERNSLKDWLLKRNITPGKGVYDVPLHLQPALSFLNKSHYPLSENFAITHLCLPIWKGLTDSEVDRVVQATNDWILRD